MAIPAGSWYDFPIRLIKLNINLTQFTGADGGCPVFLVESVNSDVTSLDDGSGSVTILESYRALLAADFHPVRTIEFHWYSAEVRALFLL